MNPLSLRPPAQPAQTALALPTLIRTSRRLRSRRNGLPLLLRRAAIFAARAAAATLAALALAAALNSPAAALPRQSSSASAPARQTSRAPKTQPAVQPPLALPPPTSTEFYAQLRSSAWTMLKDAATSERLADRSNAIAALSVLRSDPRALALVASALQDKDETVRALAANTLGDMNARREIPALRKAMNDPSPVVSFAAAKALWKLGDRSGRELFYEVLNGERKTGPGFIQSHINEAKKDLHDPKTLALIGINQASGAFLGPASIGISVVEEYAKDKSSPVQALCAGLLASDDSPDTVEQLSLALDDNNWTVRAAAARALAKIHDTNAVHKLEVMIQTDREPAVRLVAAAAVLQLTTRRGSAP